VVSSLSLSLSLSVTKDDAVVSSASLSQELAPDNKVFDFVVLPSHDTMGIEDNDTVTSSGKLTTDFILGFVLILIGRDN